MKIVCCRQTLVDAVCNVQHAVSAKSTMVTLEGILLRATASSLNLVGYDLSMGITTTIEAEVEQPGEIVLTAKLLAEIVRKLPEERVNIEVDDKSTAVIKSGDASFTLIGMSAADYPELPTVADGVGVTIPQNTLKSMINQTLFAVAQTEERPVHTGILFEIEPQSLRLVAVDGSRLAMRCETVKGSESMSFVVPGKTLHEARGLLKDEDTPLSIVVGKRHIIFEIDGYAVISRLLDGEFLPYRKAVPQNVSAVVRVKTREFISAVERVSIVINDRVKTPLLCEFKESSITVSCNTALGSVVDNVNAVTESENGMESEGEMGFNSRFLLEALKNTETDEVKLELNGPLSPMKIIPVSGDSFLFLVLPVRMRKY